MRSSKRVGSADGTNRLWPTGYQGDACSPDLTCSAHDTHLNLGELPYPEGPMDGKSGRAR